MVESAYPGGAWTPVRTLFLMVVAGLTVRLIVMGFLYTEQLDPRQDHFRFGFETGRIARSIAQGEGFSSPLYEKTGPTAWMTPVYPYIIAGFFRVFGIYTKAAALAILSFNALTSALTCLPIFFFARKSFGAHVAKWAGWTWAFFPYSVYFPVERIWETWLATLLFSLLFLIALKLENTDQISVWVGAGLLWGLAALTSAVVVSVLPFLQWRISYLRHKQPVTDSPAQVGRDSDRGKEWFATSGAESRAAEEEQAVERSGAESVARVTAERLGSVSQRRSAAVANRAR